MIIMLRKPDSTIFRVKHQKWSRRKQRGWCYLSLIWIGLLGLRAGGPHRSFKGRFMCRWYLRTGLNNRQITRASLEQSQPACGCPCTSPGSLGCALCSGRRRREGCCWAFPGISSAGPVSLLQTLLEKGRFLELLAPWPFFCPKSRVYFYSLNEKENEPCARSCSALLPQSKMNAAGKNVFIEGADFIHQRACFSALTMA